MNTKLVISLPVVLLAFSLLQPALAMGKHHDNRAQKQKTPMLLTDRAINKLGLSEGQQSQIKQIFETAKNETETDRTSLTALKKQWRILSKADVLDEQQLQYVAAQQAELKAKLKVKRLQTAKAIKLVLSEEQQEMMAKWRNKKTSQPITPPRSRSQSSYDFFINPSTLNETKYRITT